MNAVSPNAFNPHGNKTSDGVVITQGMAVTDYDMLTGTVVADDTSAFRHDNNYCSGEHWFTVERDDGTTKEFDGSRLRSR